MGLWERDRERRLREARCLGERERDFSEAVTECFPYLPGSVSLPRTPRTSPLSGRLCRFGVTDRDREREREREIEYDGDLLCRRDGPSPARLRRRGGVLERDRELDRELEGERGGDGLLGGGLVSRSRKLRLPRGL